jgi:hypothetical protein
MFYRGRHGESTSQIWRGFVGARDGKVSGQMQPYSTNYEQALREQWRPYP